MRVNIYAQEITRDFEVVNTTAENTGATFVGLRFWLESPACLKPPVHPDDDSSAVTFWVKSGNKGFQSGDLLASGTNMSGLAGTLPEQVELRAPSRSPVPSLRSDDLIATRHAFVGSAAIDRYFKNLAARQVTEEKK